MDGLGAQRTAFLLACLLALAPLLALSAAADDDGERERDRLERRLERIEDRLDDASGKKQQQLQEQADALRARLGTTDPAPPPQTNPPPATAPPAASVPGSNDETPTNGSGGSSGGRPEGSSGSGGGSTGSGGPGSGGASSGSSATSGRASSPPPGHFPTHGTGLMPTTTFTIAQEGDAAVVDARATKSPAGDIIAYHWEWGDGTRTSTTDPRTSHVYDAGWPVYHVTLIVVDAAGNKGLAWKSLPWDPSKANLIEPVVTVKVHGLGVRVDATASVSDNVIVRYVWDWGDGSPPVESPVAAHTYTDAGAYLILIELTDAEGATAFEVLAVDVHLPPRSGPSLASRGGVRTDAPDVSEVLFGSAGARWIEESPGPDLLPLSLVGAFLVGALVRRRT